MMFRKKSKNKQNLENNSELNQMKYSRVSENLKSTKENKKLINNNFNGYNNKNFINNNINSKLTPTPKSRDNCPIIYNLKGNKKLNSLIPKITGLIPFINSFANGNNISSIDQLSTINLNNKNNDINEDYCQYNKNVNKIMYLSLNNLKKGDNNQIKINNKDNESKVFDNIINIYNRIKVKNKNNNRNNEYLNDNINLDYYKSINYHNIKNRKWINKLRKSNIEDFSITHNTSYDIQRPSDYNVSIINNKKGYFHNVICSNGDFTMNQKIYNKSCEPKLKNRKKKKKKIKKKRTISNNNLYKTNNIKCITIPKKSNNGLQKFNTKNNSDTFQSDFKITSKYNNKSADKKKVTKALKRAKTNINDAKKQNTKHKRINKSFDAGNQLKKKDNINNRKLNLKSNINNVIIKDKKDIKNIKYIKDKKIKKNIENKTINPYNNNFTKRMTYDEYFGNQNNSLLLDKLKKMKSKLVKSILSNKEA